MSLRPVSLDLLIAGNYCHDTLITRGTEAERGSVETLGGSASYISAALKPFSVRYRVAARVGDDFRYADRVPQPAVTVTGAPTAHFIDELRLGERVATLQAIGPKLEPGDLGQLRARIGLACGVALELQPETLAKLRELSEVVICDAQGLLRAVGPEGRVIHRPLADTEFADGLDAIDYLKLSEEESRFVDLNRLPARTCVLLTLGARGCRIIRPGREITLPAVPAREIDSTGAGDCFLAGFALGLLYGEEELLAAHWGCYFGSLAVRQIGVPDFTAFHDERFLGDFPSRAICSREMTESARESETREPK